MRMIQNFFLPFWIEDALEFFPGGAVEFSTLRSTIEDDFDDNEQLYHLFVIQKPIKYC